MVCYNFFVSKFEYPSLFRGSFLRNLNQSKSVWQATCIFMYMRNLHLFFGLLISLLISTSLSAQITISASSDGAMTGDTVEIDIIVDNYDQLSAMQFALRWNPDVVTYRDLRNFGLDGLTNSMVNNFNFGFAQLGEGKLRYSWFDDATTLDDGSIIFTIVFDVIGATGEETDIEVTSCPDDNPPLVIEVGDAEGNPIPNDKVETNNGTVTVGTNATSESETQDFTLYQNSPNPFNKETNIRFSLKNHTDTHLSIYSYTGKVIFEKIETLGSGEHSVNIDRSVFPAAGTYFYRLKTDNSDSIRKLIVQ